MYDISIIGAGVIGSMIARELSKYDLKVCLIEKESDLAMGATKANSGIVHAGYDPEPLSLKAILNARGNRLMSIISNELSVTFKKIASLVIALNDEEVEHIQTLYQRGIKNGIKDLAILNQEEVKNIEANISDKTIAALYAPSAGIICPYELTLAAAENAIENGVDIKLECEVKEIEPHLNSFTITCDNYNIKTKYIINAAGIYADKISSMIGDNSFSIIPRKGEYILLDKSQGKIINKVIFRTPSQKGKGILATPTVDGNLLLGPTNELADEKENLMTTMVGIKEIRKSSLQTVPSIDLRETISSFAGMRASPLKDGILGGDFIIQPSAKNKAFINVAGIESPGLTASPAIAEYVTSLLKNVGLELRSKKTFNPIRKAPYRFKDLDDKEKDALILKDGRYGKIVCRCENISEGEIIDAINSPVGANNLDAIKRRTRAGMGRCQGGFCTPIISKILSDQLNVPLTEVTKNGGKSNILYRKTK